MRSIDEILHLADTRRMALGRRLRTMREVRDTYGGEVILPLPELDEHEVASIANQLQTGLDGTSQRAASTQPNVVYPSERPGYKSHDDRARSRRRASLGWWERNEIDLKDARRYRHFFGYATSPVVLRPDPVWGFARWEVRDPLDAFPAPTASPDAMCPDDAVFCFSQTLGWLRREHPAKAAFLPPPGGYNRLRGGVDDHVELVEFIDEFEVVLIARGHSEGRPLAVEADYGRSLIINLDRNRSTGFEFAVELERYANRAGRCTGVFPGRITLAGPVGQFDALPGMHYKQAKLDALEYRAIEEGVFPKLWLVSHPNAPGQAHISVVADGRQGIIGEIENGTLVNVNPQPSYLANVAQDRLERSQRISGAVPAQMGGENPTNVRTGRAADVVLTAQVDFGIAEAQKVMARSKTHELEIAAAVARGWFGKKPVSFHVNWKGARGRADYKAAELFPKDAPPPTVSYSLAGSDLESLVIQLGQRMGAGLMSKRTARRLDPMIEDAEFEDDQTVVEALEAAVLAGVQEMASQDPSFIEPLTRIMTAVALDKKSLAEAWRDEQRRVQEQQATPVPPDSPEAQPGLGVPGGAAQAGVMPEAPPDQVVFTQLLNRLHSARASMAAEGAG